MPPSAPRKPPLSSATEDFGNRVRHHRHRLDMSQERLAEHTGLHWSYIGQVERGQVNLTLHNILRLAAALRVDAGELLAGMKSPNRDT